MNLLLVRRADDPLAAALATVRVERPVCPAPILLANGVTAPGANRSDARQAVAGCPLPLPFTAQGELARGISPWPVNLQEPTRLLAPRSRTSGFRSTFRFHSKKAACAQPRAAHL